MTRPPRLLPVRVPADLHAQVKARAEHEGRTISQTIRLALRMYLCQESIGRPADAGIRDVDFLHVCPCGCREIIPIQWADCRAVVIGAGDSPQRDRTPLRAGSGGRAPGVPVRLADTGPDQGAPAPTAPLRPGVAATVPNSGGPGRPPTCN